MSPPIEHHYLIHFSVLSFAKGVLGRTFSPTPYLFLPFIFPFPPSPRGPLPSLLSTLDLLLAESPAFACHLSNCSWFCWTEELSSSVCLKERQPVWTSSVCPEPNSCLVRTFSWGGWPFCSPGLGFQELSLTLYHSLLSPHWPPFTLKMVREPFKDAQGYAKNTTNN